MQPLTPHSILGNLYEMESLLVCDYSIQKHIYKFQPNLAGYMVEFSCLGFVRAERRYLLLASSSDKPLLGSQPRPPLLCQLGLLPQGWQLPLSIRSMGFGPYSSLVASAMKSLWVRGLSQCGVSYRMSQEGKGAKKNLNERILSMPKATRASRSI
jgi:hypothetical protein